MHKDSREVIPHDELLLGLATVIGKATRARDSDRAAEAALVLAELITQEDIERSKATLKRAMKLCGCENCLKQLARIAEIEANQETGESFAV